MKSLIAVGGVLSLLVWLNVACRSPITPLLPTATPTLSYTRTPAPTPGPLTDAEAVALVREELADRGVALDTSRIAIAGAPRYASIRYSSSYAADSRVFQAQTILVALAVAQVMARVHPPINGGIRLAVMPGGESNVGLKVTLIEGTSLEAWAAGSISDQEFVSQWTGGFVTEE